MPFTFEALSKIARIDDPQVSPDGKWIAFTVQTVDLAANVKPTQIYVVAVDGGSPVRLTTEGSLNTRPRWSPDSKKLYYISDLPNGSGVSNTQVWLMGFDGTDQHAITSVPTGQYRRDRFARWQPHHLHQRCLSNLRTRERGGRR